MKLMTLKNVADFYLWALRIAATRNANVSAVEAAGLNQELAAIGFRNLRQSGYIFLVVVGTDIQWRTTPKGHRHYTDTLARNSQ